MGINRDISGMTVMSYFIIIFRAFRGKSVIADKSDIGDKKNTGHPYAFQRRMAGIGPCVP